MELGGLIELESAIEIIRNLFFVILLVFLNGFFVAAEFAIVKVRSTRIEQLKGKRAAVARKVIANLDAYLSATQLGITLASLGLGWIGEPAIAKMIEPALKYFNIPEWGIHAISFGISFSIITFLHIVLGEMAPKSLAIRQAEKTTLWTATPLNWFYTIFKPFIFVLNGTANLFLKMLGIDMNENQQAHTEEEIRMLLAQSHKSGVIDQTELTLFDNVFEFTERVAREIMVPRVKMDCLYLDSSFEENYRIIKETNHTRFPLCGVDKDDIKGIIHIRDVYEKMIEGNTPDLMELVRPMIIIPETMELKELLKNLQKNKAEMAIVVDEFGGTAGLVTTEDIIEEIFGEIQDEFDNEKPFFQPNAEGTSIDSRLLIEDVNDYFKIDIQDPDNDTIGGWLFSQLETLPKVGDQVRFGKWLFTVEEMDQLRISRIMVTPIEEPLETEEEVLS